MPLYVDIMNTLAGEIAAGKYRPDSCLPSERELCQRFQTSQKSIRAALARLRDNGLIEKRQGSGSYVREDPRRNAILNMGVAINYRPDRPAACILSSPGFAQVIVGARKAAARHAANTSLFMYDETAPIDESLFTGYRLDGLLEFFSTITPALGEYLTERKDKIVSAITPFQEARHTRGNPLVVSDYMSGVAEALKHYQKQGKRKFGFSATSTFGFKTLELYRSVFAANRATLATEHTVIHPAVIKDLVFTPSRAEYFFKILFGSKDVPDVVFSDGDFIVRELLTTFRHDAEKFRVIKQARFCVIGLPERIPEDIDRTLVDFVVPQNEQVGELAADFLLDYIKTGEEPPKRTTVPAKFLAAMK